MGGGLEAWFIGVCGRLERDHLNGSYVDVAQVDEEIKQWHGCYRIRLRNGLGMLSWNQPAYRVSRQEDHGRMQAAQVRVSCLINELKWGELCEGGLGNVPQGRRRYRRERDCLGVAHPAGSGYTSAQEKSFLKLMIRIVSKLWDSVMDRWPRHVRGLQNLSRMLCAHEQATLATL